MLQRITLALLGVVFFLGAVLNFKKIGQLFWGLLASVTALLGIVLAGRQVWLQHFPSSDTSGCEASLDYMLQIMPITQVLKKVFIGGAECSQVDWKLIGLSLAEWSLICFVVLFLFSFWQLCRKK
jgi:disulfide bond formation protein DsbB